MNSNNPNIDRRFFYGWIIAAASGLGIAFSVMTFVPTTIGLMVGPLSKAFGWTPAQIILAPTFATFSTILVAPFLGAVVDRFGARRVICISFIVEALLIASFRYIDSNIGFYYARYAALALLATGTTFVPFTKIISHWFDKRRGFAIGIALACYGIGGVIWSKGTQMLFDLFGWRQSFTYMGGFILLIVLPILLILIRDTPESKGCNADGAADDQRDEMETKQPVTGMSLGQAAGRLQFWKIVIAFFLIAAGFQSMMLNLVPMLTSYGIKVQTAASIQASLWGTMVLGRFTTGWLLDRFFAPRVALAFLIPAIIGILILGAGIIGVFTAVLGAVIIGFTNGSEGDILPYITGRYYGLKHYTKIYGTLFSCFCLGSGSGPYITAYIVEKTGSYHIIQWTLTGTMVVAGLILFTFQRFPKSHPA
jgi:MFS transporter, OFA family, oxalate/formate antiporter